MLGSSFMKCLTWSGNTSFLSPAEQAVAKMQCLPGCSYSFEKLNATEETLRKDKASHQTSEDF